MKKLIWKSGNSMKRNLSNGKYLLVFSFPNWIPKWAIDKLLNIEKEIKIFNKTILIKGAKADMNKGKLDMTLVLSENPWPVLLLYSVLIVATGIVAYFTLKQIFKIFELPFKHPVVGLAIVGTVALVAAGRLKK